MKRSRNNFTSRGLQTNKYGSRYLTQRNQAYLAQHEPQHI